MSDIRAATISNAAGTGPIDLTGQWAAKAWVNFNGAGTVAIRASGNMSSITDNGIGDYTVNFTTAMPDASYSAVASCRGAGATADVVASLYSATGGIYSTTQLRLKTFLTNSAPHDPETVCVSIFR